MMLDFQFCARSKNIMIDDGILVGGKTIGEEAESKTRMATTIADDDEKKENQMFLFLISYDEAHKQIQK